MFVYLITEDMVPHSGRGQYVGGRNKGRLVTSSLRKPFHPFQSGVTWGLLILSIPLPPTSSLPVMRDSWEKVGTLSPSTKPLYIPGAYYFQHAQNMYISLHQAKSSNTKPIYNKVLDMSCNLFYISLLHHCKVEKV